MHMLYTRKVSGALEEIGAQLEKAVKAQGFGIIGMVDLRQKMAAQGMEFNRDCRVYEVCHPCRAQQVLEKDISLSTALPCRISIYEDNGSMHVATILPTELIKLFGSPGLAQVARDLEQELIAIIDATFEALAAQPA